MSDHIIYTADSIKFEWLETSTKDLVFKHTPIYEEVILAEKPVAYWPLKEMSFNMNLTFSKPVIRKVKPEEVGVYLPGLKFIGLDGCAGEGAHASKDIFSEFYPGPLGHAHICPNDPDKGMICTNERWLKNSDGTYSEILLHELAHVITDYEGLISTKCESYDKHEWAIKATKIDKYEVGNFAHSEPWRKWARKLGVPAIPTGNPPY